MIGSDDARAVHSTAIVHRHLSAYRPEVGIRVDWDLLKHFGDIDRPPENTERKPLVQHINGVSID